MVERTNTPLASFIGFLLIGRIVIPGVLIVISWILVASPNIGLFNQMALQLTGMRNIVNIYSFWGMVWVQALELVPLIYLLLAAAFQAMDPRLEEASTMTGAGNWRTLRRISLPLALPAIGGGAAAAVRDHDRDLRGAAADGRRAPACASIPPRFSTTPRARRSTGGSPSTYSMALLAVAIVLLLLYFRLIRPRRALPDHHRQGLPAAPHRSRRAGAISPARSRCCWCS